MCVGVCVGMCVCVCVSVCVCVFVGLCVARCAPISDRLISLFTWYGGVGRKSKTALVSLFLKFSVALSLFF